MKTTITTTAVVLALFGVLHLMEDTPAPMPYEPTSDSAARVRAFVHGDMSTVDEADLYAPSVTPQLRQAALNLR
jgi:hypothetical protein